MLGMEIIIIFVIEYKAKNMKTVELRTSVLAEVASIMNNEEMLKKALAALRRIKKSAEKAPCRFSVEELKKEIELAEEDDANNQYYTSNELRKKHLSCPQN